MKRNKKKLKIIIAKATLYTICYRNVDKLINFWVYAKYDLLGGKRMFKRTELIIKNANLKLENDEIKEENQKNREEITTLELKIFHMKTYVEDMYRQLELLQEIDNRGNPEETKRKNKNLIINNLKKESINIIKELDVSGKCI